MPAEFIYTTYKLARHYPPDRTVLENISLSFYPGAKIGVIGSNGAGKSSLLRIMAGLDDGFIGEARLTPGFTVGYLSQEPELDPTKDVKGNVLDGVARSRPDRRSTTPSWPSGPTPTPTTTPSAPSRPRSRTRSTPPTPGTSSATSTSRWTPCAARPTTPTSPRSPAARSAASRSPACSCSHPDLLLLDEPTNHLDAESVYWLERFLQEYSGTVVAITHDRYFLDNVAQWILELDRGRGIPFEGNYSSWLEQKLERLGREEKAGDARQRTLARELEWVRLSPRGPAGQGQGPPRRLRAAARRGERRQAHERELEIAIPPGPRLGDQVIEVKDLRKAYGDKLLIEDLTFSLPKAGHRRDHRRQRRRQDDPVPDDRRPGAARQRQHHDRRHRPARATSTRAATTSRPTRPSTRRSPAATSSSRSARASCPARAYVSSFNFKGTDQQKPVGKLSGGERNRVHLAKLLRSGGNVLLLDEPTNDLDVDTLRALEAGLESFPGCAVVISHDRWFLDRIATHVLAFEGDSVVRWFEGNFTEYEEFRHRELGVAADQPHRIQYKRLVA